MNLCRISFHKNKSTYWARSRNWDESWELDALEPQYISDLIEDCLVRVREDDKYDEMLKQEVQDKLFFDEMIEMSGGTVEEDNGE